MGVYLEKLPSPTIDTVWINKGDIPKKCLGKVESEWLRVCKGPGWNPKLVNLGDGVLITDLCGYSTNSPLHKQLKTVQIFIYEDDPILKILKNYPHLPKVCKSPYMKENRLKYLKMTCYFTYSRDINLAEEAYSKWLKNMEV